MQLELLQDGIKHYERDVVGRLTFAHLNALGAAQEQVFDIRDYEVGWFVGRGMGAIPLNMAAGGIGADTLQASMGFNAPNYDDVLQPFDLKPDVSSQHKFIGLTDAEQGAKGTENYAVNIGDPGALKLRVWLTGSSTFADVTGLVLVVGMSWNPDLANFAGL